MYSNCTLHSCNIMKNYHPGYDVPTAASKKLSSEMKNLLDGRPSADSKLLIQIGNLRCKQFEPLFGSFCLFSFDKEVFTRVSESFYFDLTDPAISQRFPEIYQPWADDKDIEQGTLPDNAAIQSPLTLARRCIFSIPEPLKKSNLYLVWQFSKVLTNDPERIFGPYSGSSRSSNTDKENDGNCRRLRNFRQPLGFGVTRLFLDNGTLVDNKAAIKLTAFSLRNSCSDNEFGKVSITGQ